jgi:hypothetical protein
MAKYGALQWCSTEPCSARGRSTMSLFFVDYRNRQALAPLALRPQPSAGADWQGVMRHAKQSLGWSAPAWARSAAVVILGIFSVIGPGDAEGTTRIKISTAILVQPASQVPMPIQIEPADALPSNSFVRLRGLPPGVSLTEGFAIEAGVWAVPLFGLATLEITVPVDVSDQSSFLVTLVDMEGTILAEATSALIVGPAVVLAPADEERAADVRVDSRIENKPLAFRPPRNRQPTRPLAELSTQDRAGVEKLLARGEKYLAQGNIAGARAFFRHAAAAGLAVGASLLAATYDPVELQRLQVVGLIADRDEAVKWYERARELRALADPSPFTGCKC